MKQPWIQAFQGGRRRSGSGSRQQMGHSSAVMTARYTGEIPLEQVRVAFSGVELENMEDGRSTCSRLVVYNRYAREKSGRRTMAV
jgi:hypothetical protein